MRHAWLMLCLWLCWLGSAWGAVSFDAVSSATAGCTNCNSLAWSHTIGSGCNQNAGIVTAMTRHTVTTSISTVDFGGTGLTRQGGAEVDFGGGEFLRSDVWAKVNLTKGSAQTVTITPNTTGMSRIFGGMVSSCGVHQTASFGVVATANGTTGAPSVSVTCVAGELCIDGLLAYPNDPVPSGGQTLNWAETNVYFAESSRRAGATSSMSWTTNQTEWVLAAMAVKAAPSRRRVGPMYLGGVE